MNMIEKQVEFGKKMFEINQNTFQAMVSHQQFGQKLPEVKDVTSFMELQKDYGQSLWGGVKESTKTQVEILKSSFEETSTVVTSVFTPSETVVTK
jgi:hypothetical protein